MPFACGLAPVQISYLGYPGTLGTNFIHYIVADKIIIPADQREYYSENIIYLPNTYQPTDNKRKISNAKLRRKILTFLGMVLFFAVLTVIIKFP